jgi:hypothetical protein
MSDTKIERNTCCAVSEDEDIGHFLINWWPKHGVGRIAVAALYGGDNIVFAIKRAGFGYTS